VVDRGCIAYIGRDPTGAARFRDTDTLEPCALQGFRYGTANQARTSQD
jgi:hypothetical protein